MSGVFLPQPKIRDFRPGTPSLRIIFCRSASGKCSSSCSKVRTGCNPPDMGVLFPLLPFGTPPPLGIGDNPPKMRDLLFHKGANHAFMKTSLEKSLSLALTYLSGEQYKLNIARGARRATRRARRSCLLNVSFGLRGRISRRGVQAAAAPPVNAWVSGA